jgi:hypothetical protein
MTIEDTIIASVIHEHQRKVIGGRTNLDDARSIGKYGRKMIRWADSGKLKPTDTNEEIAASLSAGLVVWLFWQIAPELLLWIVAAIRKRIWQQELHQ